MNNLKTREDIVHLKISGKILASVLNELKKKAVIGASLKSLDLKARELIKSLDAKSAFFGYQSKKDSRPYPAAICTSVNEKIVHTIPDKYILKNGDVLKIDLGINYKSYITDAAITIGIGKISPLAEKLIKATRTALYEAIKICRPGKKIGDIGWVIESTVKNYGFSVVKKLTGHGVGFELHEEPSVYNFGEQGTGIELEEGLVLAIEPMVAAGSGELIEKENGEFFTKDGSLSAHFEHTVAITKNGPEILTLIE